MFRRVLNKLMENGLWFATMMIHIMLATITSLVFTLVSIAIKWIEKHT